MQSIKKQFISNIIFFCLIYALMFYIIARVVSLVITHDEAYSFYNVKHFWYVETLCTGNTHWFNFLAIKMATFLGFEKASQLRWFTVFSAGVYLTTVYFWIKNLKDFPTKFFAFAVALLNPFLIDYLGLARGYATGLMFESLAIVCIYISIKRDKRNLATLALFFAGMAAIANFNFFYFFAAFSFIYFYKFYLKQGLGFIKQSLFYIECIYAISITWLVLRALKFITECSNDIGDYGGDEFVSSVFVGMLDTFIYGKFQTSLLQLLAFVLFTVVLGTSLYGVLAFKKHKIVWYQVAGSLLLLMFTLMTINKWCFDVLYPTYRTCLMLYPLIALALVGFMSSITTKKKIKAIVLYVITATITVHFITTLNLSKTFDYYQQEDSILCFDYLKNNGARKVGLTGELYGVYRNYYQMTEKYNYLFEAEQLNTQVALRDNYDASKIKDYEYLVLFPPYNMAFYKNQGIHLEGVNYYKRSGTLVLRVINPK
jgi:hypothetical protein